MTNEQVNKWTNKRNEIIGKKDTLTITKLNQLNQTYVYTNSWMYGWMNEWMNEYMVYEQLNKRKKKKWSEEKFNECLVD